MTTEENTCRSAHLTRIWLAHTGSLGFTVTVDSDELGVVVGPKTASHLPAAGRSRAYCPRQSSIRSMLKTTGRMPSEQQAIILLLSFIQG